MKDPAVDVRRLTENEIFTGLKEIICEVAPLKVVAEIKPEDSLVEDFAFDSIDTMQLLLKIRERFLADEDMSIDIDGFLKEAYSDCEEKPVTVRRLCRLIADYT